MRDQSFAQTMQPFLVQDGVAADDGEAFDLILSDGLHKAHACPGLLR